MLLRRPFCMLNRHRVDKASVHWNGNRLVGTCPDCGRTVRNSSRTDYWKLHDPAETVNPE